MKTIHYSRMKLATMAAMALLFVWGGIWAMTVGEGRVFFAGLIAAPMGLYSLGFTLKYLADNTIVKLGRTGLEYHGLFGTRTVRYDHVISVEIESTTVNFMSQRHLAIKSADHTLGKTRIAEMLLEKSSGNLEGVLNAIVSASEEPEQKARPARRLDRAKAGLTANPVQHSATGFGRKVV